MKHPYRVIALTQGYVAVIDAAHYRRVNKYSWHMHKSKGSNKKPGQPYARATIDGKKVYLHRYITGAYHPMHVDHRNHQTLDCREENLKVCTHVENLSTRRNLLKNRKKCVDIKMDSVTINITEPVAIVWPEHNEENKNVSH